MKRYLSLLLVICILLFTSAGCHNGTQNSSANESRPALLQNVKFDKHLEISVAFWNIQQLAASSKADGILDYVQKLFNITIKPIVVTWSDYEEKYNIMAVTDTLPDIVATNMTGTSNKDGSSSLINLVEKHAIRPLPENLDEFPRVQKVLSVAGNCFTQFNGKQYIIPRTSFDNVSLSCSDAALVVRKDWMEKLGISDPQSFSEFKNMLVRFAKDDPDGDGINNTIGLNVYRYALAKWVALGIAPDCNVYTWIRTQNGFQPSYVQPQFEKLVSAYRDLYTSGALDPDFYIKKASDPVDDFVHGRLGALEYKSSPSTLSELSVQWNMYQTTSFEDSVKTLPIFPAEDGKRYSNTSSVFWSESAFSSRVDDEKMQRILWLYEYLLSDDGWNLTRMGISGEDYEMRDGEYQSKLTGDSGDSQSVNNLLIQKYPSLALLTSLASWGGCDNDFKINSVNNQRYGEDVMKMASDDLAWNIENTVPVNRPFDFFNILQDGNIQFSRTKVIDDFTQVIIGNDDPVQMWRQTVQEYYNEGLEDYINQKNQQAKQLGIS